MPATLVLLHGFAGTGRAWDGVVDALGSQRYRSLAPDLRGHGSASAARPVTFEACVRDVLELTPGRFDLVGYSLGGRLALHVALAAPERVRCLTLISTTAGIEDPAARVGRRADDARLADEIERGSIEDFAARWLRGALFRDDGPEATRRARDDILRNEPAGLAAALRGIGTGEMEPLWHRLGALGGLDGTVVTGERDAKFTALGQRLAGAIAGARHLVVAGAGHALPRLTPGELAEVVGRAGG